MTAKHNVGVGFSSLVDSYTAGKEAALSAIDKTGGRTKALLVFAAMSFNHRELLAGITSVTGTITMVGGTTAGEISPEGVSSGTVVIMAFAHDDLEFVSGIGQDMSADETACSVQLVNDILGKTAFDPDASLMVFPNGMGGDGLKVLEGLQHLLGKDFEITGGYLGDDERFESTFQYYNGKVYRDTIVGLMITDPEKKYRRGIGVRSGFTSIGNSLVCTSSDGNVLKEFEHTGALELYKDFLGEERASRLPGICLEYPFGIIDKEPSGRSASLFQLRCGLSVDHEKGTITLAASIPEGSEVTLTTASRGDIINGALEAAEQAKKVLGGATPEAIVMFSCVGRKLVLGRRVQEEVGVVRDCLGPDVPVIGFFTYGEIGPVDKTIKERLSAKFHNETVVLWVLGKA
ncbi:MAG: hypothetical protein HGA62_07175 [Chlorobiaceae bacterium]|nr:hypothetical protein [Chlorobiaceae bacterium]NTV59736.1 hypothetical protein [Chlorobiaceae bacterium]